MTDRTPTVLVVDDDEMVTASIRTFLELETRYRVLTDTSPVTALETLDSTCVDVVIADFLMPELDGVEFLKAVRARKPHTTRVLLTGYADVQNAIRAINDAGLYYYLEKPWHNDHLKLVIRNGIERSSLVNELDARIRALEDANEELFEIRRRLIHAFL